VPEILGFFEARHKRGSSRSIFLTTMAPNANPAVPVSAADRAIGVPRVGVGVVVLNSEDRVLIGKRKSPHGQGSSAERIDGRNMVSSWRILPVNAIDTRATWNSSKRSKIALDAKSSKKRISC
jgi:hypothetical protein